MESEANKTSTPETERTRENEQGQGQQATGASTNIRLPSTNSQPCSSRTVADDDERPQDSDVPSLYPSPPADSGLEAPNVFEQDAVMHQTSSFTDFSSGSSVYLLGDSYDSSCAVCSGTNGEEDDVVNIDDQDEQVQRSRHRHSTERKGGDLDLAMSSATAALVKQQEKVSDVSRQVLRSSSENGSRSGDHVQSKMLDPQGFHLRGALRAHTATQPSEMHQVYYRTRGLNATDLARIANSSFYDENNTGSRRHSMSYSVPESQDSFQPYETCPSSGSASNPARTLQSSCYSSREDSEASLRDGGNVENETGKSEQLGTGAGNMSKGGNAQCLNDCHFEIPQMIRQSAKVSMCALMQYHLSVLPHVWRTCGFPVTASNKVISDRDGHMARYNDAPVFALHGKRATGHEYPNQVPLRFPIPRPAYTYSDILAWVQTDPLLLRQVCLTKEIADHIAHAFPSLANRLPLFRGKQALVKEEQVRKDTMGDWTYSSGDVAEHKNKYREVVADGEVVRQELVDLYFVCSPERQSKVSKYLHEHITAFKYESPLFDERRGSKWVLVQQDDSYDISEVRKRLQPMLKDVSICSSGLNSRESHHTYAAFYSRRITYSFPATFLSSRKKIQSRRDAEVVRLKKYLLRKVVNRLDSSWVSSYLLQSVHPSAGSNTSPNVMFCSVLPASEMPEELWNTLHALAVSSKPSEFHYHETDYDVEFDKDMVIPVAFDCDGYYNGKSNSSKMNEAATCHSESTNVVISRSEAERNNQSRSRPSRNLPPAAISVLKEWMFNPEHITHPYPTEKEKAYLEAKANITRKQLNNWFINARKRLWQKGAAHVWSDFAQSCSSEAATSTTSVEANKLKKRVHTAGGENISSDAQTSNNALQLNNKHAALIHLCRPSPFNPPGLSTLSPSQTPSSYPPRPEQLRSIPRVAPAKTAPSLPNRRTAPYNEEDTQDSTSGYHTPSSTERLERVSRAREMARAILASSSASSSSSQCCSSDPSLSLSRRRNRASSDRSTEDAEGDYSNDPKRFRSG
eukprot:gb/GECG01005511.1/.p1 GENE.gb/GECG01005511.1/~~gb/GECG01005511.1/.p1  ORF type:complete len:1027 (+),score=127.22 gb/GECG01005511.1/:1-3081(+)